MPKRVHSVKRLKKTKVRTTPRSIRLGKRGRPRKKKLESGDKGPANWKWRSNVFSQESDEIKATNCSYNGCEKVITSVRLPELTFRENNGQSI